METLAKTELQQRYQQLKNRIHKLALSKTSEPELLAVSKSQPEESLRTIFACGQRRFGENYIQELSLKSEAMRDLPIEWIYIGHLQSNKIRKIVSIASEIQSVGTLRQAELIARHAVDFNKLPFPIWIEVNAAHEREKHGCSFAELPNLVTAIQSLPQLRLKGIMSIPPALYHDSEPIEVPELYRQLRLLADQIGEKQLSLGMSSDLETAIMAGSNVVRVGTMLFGGRPS